MGTTHTHHGPAVELDGASGEGGGQILRSALAASLITGRSLRIHNIRGRRRKPGLLRQHLAAVRLAAQVGNAAVEGAELGSVELAFHPQGLRAGTYQSAIGSAGSTTLVLQTVLVPLLCAEGPSRLVLEGGTHNPLAPTFEFIQQAFLPTLWRMGASVSVSLVRAGFFPAGGGQLVVDIGGGGALRPLEILERGPVRRQFGRIRIANLTRTIADRELRVLGRGLQCRDLEILESEGPGPGNVVSYTIECERVTQVCTAFGARGVSAGKVASDVVEQARAYLRTDLPVGEYLADQVLLPMAVWGGRFRCGPLSEHARTNLDVLRSFWDLDVTVQSGATETRVSVAPAS